MARTFTVNEVSYMLILRYELRYSTIIRQLNITTRPHFVSP